MNKKNYKQNNQLTSMKTLNEIKTIVKKYKPQLSEKYKIKKIGIFGSYVRNEQKDNSDVDILVEFNEPIGLEFVDLAEFFENILGMKVDLVSKRGIKENKWRYIEKEVVYV